MARRQSRPIVPPSVTPVDPSAGVRCALSGCLAILVLLTCIAVVAFLLLWAVALHFDVVRLAGSTIDRAAINEAAALSQAAELGCSFPAGSAAAATAAASHAAGLPVVDADGGGGGTRPPRPQAGVRRFFFTAPDPVDTSELCAGLSVTVATEGRWRRFPLAGWMPGAALGGAVRATLTAAGWKAFTLAVLALIAAATGGGGANGVGATAVSWAGRSAAGVARWLVPLPPPPSPPSSPVAASRWAAATAAEGATLDVAPSALAVVPASASLIEVGSTTRRVTRSWARKLVKVEPRLEEAVASCY